MFPLKSYNTLVSKMCVIILLILSIATYPKSSRYGEKKVAKKYVENYLNAIDTKKNRKRLKVRQSRKPKLLFVENYFPPITSTAALNQLISLLDSRKFDITICARKNGLSNWSHPDIDRYNLMSREKLFIDKLPPDLREYDIIFCQFGNLGSFFMQIKRRLRLKAKIVTCFRGCDITRNVKNNPRMYNELFAHGDLFLPVCDFFRNKLIDLDCDPSKIQVIRSTIDCNKFQFNPTPLQPKEPIRLTTICRLVEKKGVEDSIKAVARLIHKYPNMYLTIIGFGPLKHKLEELIDNLGANKNIKLAGRYSQEQVIQALRDTHIFILPCLTANNDDAEGIPNALKEAMATGIPVISTYHAGIPELVEDGVSGLLVEERDHRTLSKKIEFLIKNPHTWHKMGTAGRKKIMNMYEKNKENKRLVATLLALINGEEPQIVTEHNSNTKPKVILETTTVGQPKVITKPFAWSPREIPFAWSPHIQK